ncbi:hypothetical protein [Microbacterium sp. CFBP9034]|uniref:hypothetical protein n=1 Tax=Microbacterium sp. CFBP9034 TaxID=3096540 RepID=UPI002A6A2942|nr:hypothetical protein [Microbacterium sp. CFBP9034]MDY0909510.1 hypothetical protein [Microbacterium sp. CFBP9034]
MIRHYAQLLDPPRAPNNLTADHVDSYLRVRAIAIGVQAAKEEARNAALTFDLPPLAGMVAPELRDRMRQHNRKRHSPRPGYSDGELRRIITAARADVRAIRSRLTQSGGVPEAEQGRFEAAQQSGFVSVAGLPVQDQTETRDRIARRLFVTADDLIPMFVLLVVTTGWNVEVIKELPSRFRRIEDLAVEVEVTKRRRGAGRWHQTTTWEIGPAHKELETPGGLYLLFHTLMAPARALVSDAPFWVTWHRAGQGKQGVRSTFGKALSVTTDLQGWVRSRGILADPVTERDAPLPLVLNFNRLKTSIDVRRTRQMGGHLPSAARSNSTTVLFRNYLSGDPTTIDWAREVVADALTDVERASWDAHRKSLEVPGRTSLRIRPSTEVGGATADGAETAWTQCADHDHHPATGRRCTASFLDCFHCGNCVITDDHLPRLLSLLDALEQRRHQMTDNAWWERYGATWAAIRLEVLPTFSEAELSHAAKTKPDDSLLDLVEPTWEQP